MDLTFPPKIETLIRQVMSSHQQGMSQQKYADLVYNLLEGELKYNLFAKLYPDYACYDMFIRLENIGSYQDYLDFPSKFNGKWYGGDHGSEVIIYHGPKRFMNCIENVNCGRKQPGVNTFTQSANNSLIGRIMKLGREAQCGSLAVYLSYFDHAGMIWIDRENLVINRYDPYYCWSNSKNNKNQGYEEDQMVIDYALGDFFGELLPGYRYYGNTLDMNKCIQAVKTGNKQYSDYFCQDYSILYAIRRIHGMSHEEAAADLVRGKDLVIREIEELLRTLIYVRYE